MRRPVLWENLWVKIYEGCKCFAFYMWGFCLCMQHCAWNVCIKWNAVMWNWCKTKHDHLNHPQFCHLVISMAWYNWKLQKKVVWPKCTQVGGIYIQLNYHLTLCLSQGGSWRDDDLNRVSFWCSQAVVGAEHRLLRVAPLTKLDDLTGVPHWTTTKSGGTKTSLRGSRKTWGWWHSEKFWKTNGSLIFTEQARCCFDILSSRVLISKNHDFTSLSVHVFSTQHVYASTLFLNMSGVPFESACCFRVPFVCSVVSDHHHSGRMFDLCQGVVCFPPEARCDLFSGLLKKTKPHRKIW